MIKSNKILNTIKKVIKKNNYTIANIDQLVIDIQTIDPTIQDQLIKDKAKEAFINYIQLVETHIIKSTNPDFAQIDNMMFLSKNLYNKALYLIKQKWRTKISSEFFQKYNFLSTKYTEYGDFYKSYHKEANCSTFLSYEDLHEVLLNSNGVKDKDYKHPDLPSAVAQQILMVLMKNWTSYFEAIKEYNKNPSKFLGRPKPPKYLDKNGRNLLIFPDTAIIKSKLETGIINLTKLKVSIPFLNRGNGNKVCQVRIIPLNSNNVKIEIVYKKKIKDKPTTANPKFASIDLGIKNMSTLSFSEKNIQPIVFRSEDSVSFNQYYNKKLALYKSELPNGVLTSNKIKTLTSKRNNKIKSNFHEISRAIVNILVKNKVDKLIIGYSEGWKQKINLHKKTNQKFVQLPYLTFINQLTYKCEIAGIEVIIHEESYTSQASFLDLDPMPVFNKKDKKKNTIKFSGIRKNRGLYISNSGKKINADVNGSYNTMRKAAPTIFTNQGDLVGVLVHPEIWKSSACRQVRIKSHENIFQNVDIEKSESITCT